MNEPKTYVPKCNCKEVQTQHGTILKLSFRASDLAEFARQNQNEAGWLNLCIAKRQTEGKYGETHSIWLDTYKPKPRSYEPKSEQTGSQPADTNSDVPF